MAMLASLVTFGAGFVCLRRRCSISAAK
jgi:hypothetical protein